MDEGSLVRFSVPAIAVGFCCFYAAVQSPSHIGVFMRVYILPLARHKVMIFLDD